ncbi:DUF6285 domain-containing protein (plasmid) [Embleya sp. NBC_00888]|uniref:DUF6285 domain-containing protein n=1 Tax=Embleya sp. NBC_00888 TaxID=2975960 RepID=UPI002F910BB0|nr:DUF6285 domain-containing protein [Embleya sp. NBC_00888]
MQYTPTAAQLVDAVAEWLEAVGGTSPAGTDRYHARVAVRVLRMVERELVVGTGHHAPDREAVLALIVRAARPDADDAGRPTGATVDEVDASADDAQAMREAAAAIRDGVLAPDAPGLVPALRAHAVRRLEVVNPDYLLPKDRPSKEPVLPAPASHRKA